MTDKTRLSIALALGALTAVAGCARKSDATQEPRPTQAAVSHAVQRTTAATRDPAELEADQARAQSERSPATRLEGAGATATLRVESDAHHVDARSVRTETGFAVSWGDRDHRRAYVQLANNAGQLGGAAAMVREAISEEEDVYPPSLVAVGGGYAMAWSDAANGRVRFARIDQTRRPMGRATIVHEGLEAPRSTRLVANGQEFGVGVSMDHGVYFARVGRDGTRIGDGALLAEEVDVRSVDALTASSAGYELRWTESSGAQRSARVSSNGRVLAVRTVSDPSRVASR